MKRSTIYLRWFCFALTMPFLAPIRTAGILWTLAPCVPNIILHPVIALNVTKKILIHEEQVDLHLELRRLHRAKRRDRIVNPKRYWLP